MALVHRLVGMAARMVWRITRPRTIGVRAVLLGPDGRVALVRHSYIDVWYLPGGGVKKGESVTHALHRELAEEVAVTDAAVERVLGVYHNRREGKDDHVIVYVARAANDALRRADVLEVAEAGWFAPDALPAGTSPATLRRIEEFRLGATGGGCW
ncbi:NUDIX domain-containing protein [uncultured Chryseobacterium sp.]|uniref:NUDIX domain-containing protein n=1 Tax=uncultured Chryseobacterium sp. TaxID=259322 RepID=UPI0025F394F3|nr:NUDIX domain-containing protein [uncultured Chryseobacterium sp.]